jgi:two-component system LytT family response regulator
MAEKDAGAGPTGRPITAVIIAESPRSLARTRKVLTTVSAIDLVGETTVLAGASDLIRAHRPDVVFIDAKTADRAGSGLLAAADPSVSFVVVADDAAFAADAFRRGAVDYLLRPLTSGGLTVTVRRLEFMLSRQAAGSAPQPSATQPRSGRAGDEPATAAGGSREAALTIDDKVAVSLERGRSVDLVPVSDIVWIEALQNYSRLQLVDRKPVILKRTLTEWESLLPAEHFGRISRSVIIQLTRLRSSQWQSRDETLLAFDGIEERLPIGRSAAARLKELFRGGRR